MASNRAGGGAPTQSAYTAAQYKWPGRQDDSALRASPLRGRRASPRRSLALPRSSRTLRFSSCRVTPQHNSKWLGRQDSNLRMRGSKPRALPLGYAPITSCLHDCRVQGRPVQSPGDECIPLRRNPCCDFPRFRLGIEGGKDTGTGACHPCRGMRIQPVQCRRYLRIPAPNHRLAVIAAVARKKVAYCHPRRVPCQFRVGKNSGG